MSTEASAVSMAVDADPAVNGGLHSPPDSTNAPKHDASDSELSDLEDTEDDIGEITPDHYADNGRVPVFKPTYHQFKNFTVYMNKINPYGMKSGIVKVIPPEEWKAEQPNLDEAIKTIRVKEPIKQDIMGTNGAYRQANILHQRSYNLPQWRALCEQSEHQPPAKRGERRANADKYTTRAAPRTRNSTPSTVTPGSKRKPGRPRKAKAKKGEEDGEEDSLLDRLPTPISPRTDEVEIKEELLEQDDTPVKGKGRQPKATTASVSARRKNNRRDAVGKIDEAAFKDFDYRIDGSEYTPERCEELERAYWKTLTYAPPLYGADMPGTLFDDRTKAWNLGKLENLLDVLGTKIPGVNTAYLYLGMWKATFAWHLEDVDLYSINYNHFGAPKQWYSISQDDAHRFEDAMKQIFPADARACDQFLRHKTFLISPSTLLNNYNVQVNKVVHHPGEFVITFPRGYHSGYNLGYNCAEAVNFALESWLGMGRIAKRCECDQAQDSVWIDVNEIERKLRGEKTPEYYEVTDDEDDEEDEDEEEDAGPTDLPTPPDSSGDAVKIKLVRTRKRKRVANDKEDKTTVKKVRRIGKVGKQPCCLCPNDFPLEPLLPTDNGNQAHRRCGQYIPETDIDNESGATERVVHVSQVAKARLELKCGFCSLKVGACFQCSQKKCARAYHATCAVAAGVFVEHGESSVFGEDGTEYKVPEIQFSCRFHRVKRDKKLTVEDLEKDNAIREAALQLKKGDLCQFRFLESKEWFGGNLVENRMDEGMLLVDILPHGARVEVEYKWLMIGQPGDYNIIKPSPNAIPMPKQHVTTTKRQTDDLPRPDDKFGDSDVLVWKEFNQCDPAPKNPEQVKIDLSKENQIWYYLGKNSTEARAQFTEDIIHKPRHNPKGLFMETVPKPTYTSSLATPRQSYPASHPNQNAMNAARARPQPQSISASRLDKPYEYKPRVPADVSFTVDPQALQQQRKYVATAMGNGSNNSAQNWRPPLHNMNFLPPSVRANQSSSSGNTGGRTILHSPFAGRMAYGAAGNSSGRQGSSSARYSSHSNPFARYAYLQVEHNRSPLEYKTPYNPGSGFTNGYEGDLKKHLQSTPGAFSKYANDISKKASTSSTPNYKTNSLPPPRKSSYGRLPEPTSYSPYENSNTNVYGPRSTTYAPYSSPSLPSRSTANPASTQPKYANYRQYGAQRPSAPSLTATTNSNIHNAWEKKDPVMHPAIRKDYMFHNQYQPNQSPALPRPQGLAQSKPDSYQYKPQQFQPQMRAEMPMQQFQSPKQPDAQVPSRNPFQSSQSPVDNGLNRQELRHSAPAPAQYEMQAPKPMYPHQQYFQKQPPSTGYATSFPEAMQPTQPRQEAYQQLPSLPQMAPMLQRKEEPIAKVAECPPDMSRFTLELMANLKKAAS